MPKTNKSIAKRVKITRTGKILLRKPGKDHFNAKAPGQKQLRLKRWQEPAIDKKEIKRLLPYGSH